MKYKRKKPSQRKFRRSGWAAEGESKKRQQIDKEHKQIIHDVLSKSGP